MKNINHTHIKAFDQFFGIHIHLCADKIDLIAGNHKLRVNITDLEDNFSNIDIEDDRLNVGLQEGKVSTFSIG